MSDSQPSAERAGVAARIADVRALAARAEEGVSGLIAMLDEPHWSVRREVVARLAALGDVSLPSLLRVLQTQRTSEASIAASVDALAGSSGERVDGMLISLADQAEPAFLADIAQILGRRRSGAANDLLRRMTVHPDDNVAVSAIEALGRLGGRAAVDALIACVNSQNFFRTFPAIDVLGRSRDPRAVEPLTQLLHDSRYALEAARALGRCADRHAIPPLIALLSSPADGNVRVACVALTELRDRYVQLYGSSAKVEGYLPRASSEAVARRITQSAARGDKQEKIAACRLLGELKAESATPFLLPQLDAEPELAEAAAKALLEIGQASEGALFAALSEGDSRRRLSLLPVVTSLRSLEAVLCCLDDATVEVRALGCETLARIGAVAAVSRLFTLLSDEQQRVVRAAVAAIQSLGSDQTEALALLAASSAHPPTRRAALRVLSYFGFPSALPFFVAAVRDPDPRVRSTVLHGLALLELPEATEQLLAVASDPDPGLRAAGMRALGQLSRAVAVVERLREGLRDPDPWVRYYACQAVGRLALEGGEGEIRLLLEDPAGQVRVAAIEALSHAKSPAALETLRNFAAHPDLDMRRAALLGLGLMGDRQSLSVMANVAGSADEATRMVALSALAAIPGEGVVPVLASAALDAVEGIRTAAVNLLAERAGREAAEALVQLLGTQGERELVAVALTSPLEGRLPALETALQQADDDRAALFVSCLSRSRADGAGAALLRTLASHNSAARKAAVSALAASGTQEARTAIEQLSRVDLDPDVRTTCLLCLAQ